MPNACTDPSDTSPVPGCDLAVAEPARVLVEEWPRRPEYLRGLTVHIGHRTLNDKELALIVPLLNAYHAGNYTEATFTTRLLQLLEKEAATPVLTP